MGQRLWIASVQYGSGTHRDNKRHALFILIAQQRMDNHPGSHRAESYQATTKTFTLADQSQGDARESQNT
jgi:hypothetical protein